MSKQNWPELVGMTWQEAEKKIKSEYPKIMIQVLPEDSMVTMDYREDRVRIMIDKDNKVAQEPRIG